MLSVTFSLTALVLEAGLSLDELANCKGDRVPDFVRHHFHYSARRRSRTEECKRWQRLSEKNTIEAKTRSSKDCFTASEKSGNRLTVVIINESYRMVEGETFLLFWLWVRDSHFVPIDSHNTRAVYRQFCFIESPHNNSNFDVFRGHLLLGHYSSLISRANSRLTLAPPNEASSWRYDTWTKLDPNTEL